MIAEPDVPLYPERVREEARRWTKSFAASILLFLVVILCAAGTGLLDIPRLVQGTPSIAKLAGEMAPPDFRNAGDWVKPLFQTVIMSVAGTSLAVLLSLPLGCLAARNVAPNRAVYWLARGILNALRGIPELILGILFVAAVGFGVLPGVLALGIHSAGMIGKFFAESIVLVAPGPVEAVRSTRASP